MKQQTVNIGLYRHFKGAYYFVQNIVLDAVRNCPMCYYFNVLHPEKGLFVRPVDEWFSEDTDKGLIKDRPDNTTGQTTRFAKVVSLGDEVKNLSTDHLIRELKGREDSPLQTLDIDGLSDCVFCTDYVVGDKNYATEDYPCGVSTVASFTTEEEAKNYYATHKHLRATGVFKRTFIEIR